MGTWVSDFYSLHFSECLSRSWFLKVSKELARQRGRGKNISGVQVEVRKAGLWTKSMSSLPLSFWSCQLMVSIREVPREGGAMGLPSWEMTLGCLCPWTEGHCSSAGGLLCTALSCWVLRLVPFFPLGPRSGDSLAAGDSTHVFIINPFVNKLSLDYLYLSMPSFPCWDPI